jgi:hypothetical protein
MLENLLLAEQLSTFHEKNISSKLMDNLLRHLNDAVLG